MKLSDFRPQRIPGLYLYDHFARDGHEYPFFQTRFDSPEYILCPSPSAPFERFDSRAALAARLEEL